MRPLRGYWSEDLYIYICTCAREGDGFDYYMRICIRKGMYPLDLSPIPRLLQINTAIYKNRGSTEHFVSYQIGTLLLDI